MSIDTIRIKLETEGYVLIDINDLSNEILKDAQMEINKIISFSKKGQYQNIRVYDDYLFGPNIAGIEMPFSPKIISNKIINLLNCSNIPVFAKDLLGEKVKLTLSRYHITGSYSHIGKWHRDSDIGDKNSIQISLFLFDEMGLELIPGSHKEGFDFLDTFFEKNRYSKIKNSIKLNVKAGQILFFNPSIVHRGISKKSRANIHFRFETDKAYEFKKNVSIENYCFDKNWLDIFNNRNSIIIDKNIPKYKWEKGFKKSLLRFVRTALHFLLFFMPIESFIFKKTNSQPSLKIYPFNN